MEIEKIIERLKCPRINGCPISDEFSSCSACQKCVNDDTIEAINELRSELHEAKAQCELLNKTVKEYQSGITPGLTAVWVESENDKHKMECSNCGAEARYQLVGGVWRYEPYCAHCGARVYKQEELPKSEDKKLRWTEQEVENAKAIKRIFEPGEIEYVELNEEGYPVLSSAGYMEYGYATTVKKSAFPSLKPDETVWLGSIIEEYDEYNRRKKEEHA